MKNFFLISVLALVALPAFATTEESPEHPSYLMEEMFMDVMPRSSQSINPSEAFMRTLLVFDQLGVPKEPDTQSTFDDLQGKPSAKALQSRLRLMDFSSQVRSFSKIEGGEFKVYQDRSAMRVLDYSVRLDPTDEQKS